MKPALAVDFTMRGRAWLFGALAESLKMRYGF